MQNRVFYKNTILLYILKLSNYLFNFITVPLQTRIFGANNYALLGFSIAITTYFQNFIDFGFTLSGTEKVSKFCDDNDKISIIHSTVFYAKLLLLLFSMIIFIVLFYILRIFNINNQILLFYYISSVLIAFSPDYLYLGLQKVEQIMFRTLISKSIFTILLFITLKKSNQLYLVPIYQIFGNLFSIIFIYFHIVFVLKIKFVKVRFQNIVLEILNTSQFYASRLFLTLFSTINTLSLGYKYGTDSLELGYYRPAEQLVSTGKQVIGPVSDSLYPYMVTNKDMKLFKKIFKIGILIILIGSIIVFIFSDNICLIIFGTEFIKTSYYLRLLTPCVLLSFITVMTGYPLLSPLGLTKFANYSSIVSSIFHIVFVLLLIIFNKFSVSSLCILTIFSELMNSLIRIFIYFNYRMRFKE